MQSNIAGFFDKSSGREAARAEEGLHSGWLAFLCIMHHASEHTLHVQDCSASCKWFMQTLLFGRVCCKKCYILHVLAVSMAWSFMQLYMQLDEVRLPGIFSHYGYSISDKDGYWPTGLKNSLVNPMQIK